MVPEMLADRASLDDPCRYFGDRGGHHRDRAIARYARAEMLLSPSPSHRLTSLTLDVRLFRSRSEVPSQWLRCHAPADNRRCRIGGEWLHHHIFARQLRGRRREGAPAKALRRRNGWPRRLAQIFGSQARAGQIFHPNCGRGTARPRHRSRSQAWLLPRGFPILPCRLSSVAIPKFATY
jgi:hypothetical protein